jgi:transposase
MAYSKDLRNKVIEMYKNNQTRLSISSVLKIRYKTICDWVSRYNETGNCNLKRDSKLGRSRRFDNKELVLKCIEDDPNISGKEIKAKLAPTISNACFYNSLKRMGLTYKKKNVDTSKGVKRKELNIGNWLLK